MTLDRRGRLLALAAGAVLGAAIGLAVPRVGLPSNDEVRVAARQLVPAGYEISKESSGYRGNFPSKGPFGAGVETVRTVDPAAAEAAAQAQAESAGWRLVRIETDPGARVLRLSRRNLTGNVFIFTSSNEILFGVQRLKPAVAGPIAGGGVVGLCIALGVLWVRGSRLSAGGRRAAPGTR